MDHFGQGGARWRSTRSKVTPKSLFELNLTISVDTWNVMEEASIEH